MQIDQPHENFIIKLLRKNPKAAFQYVAATIGMDQKILEQAQDIFESANHIEIRALKDDQYPGIIIILNQKFSLWFYKYGDEYRYDGFELGDYSDTFDALKIKR